VHRRTLLKGAAALPLVALGAPASLMRRVRPGDAAWPTAASWQKLKDAVGGNLIEVHSLFGACEKEPGAAACLEAAENIHNPFYIGDQPAGTQVSGWLDAWTPAPSVYALKARHTADVVAGVNFARQNRLRLVVKGGGHSYQGTSNAADSLRKLEGARRKIDAIKKRRADTALDSAKSALDTLAKTDLAGYHGLVRSLDRDTPKSSS